MTTDRVVAIWRSLQLSTGDISRDSCLMGNVSLALRRRDVPIYELNEDQELPLAKVYVTMARSQRMLDMLAACEREGALVINSTASVRLCLDRRALETCLSEGGVEVPGEYTGTGPCWLKQNGMAGHVVFARDEQELEQQKHQFRKQGITDWLVSPHINGRHAKFYGVAGTEFFWGEPSLRQIAERAAQLVGITVYGGDAIIREDGSCCIVDLNDWPSFSPCVEEAAEAIAERMMQMMKEREENGK